MIEIPKGYCAIAVGVPKSGNYRLLSVSQRVVVFESKTQAEDFIYKLAGDQRQITTDDKMEWFSFHPNSKNKINRACIVIDYNPYDAPLPVRSEAHAIAWRYHILHWLAFHDCGQFEKQSDGSTINAETNSLIMPPSVNEEIHDSSKELEVDALRC